MDVISSTSVEDFQNNDSLKVTPIDNLDDAPEETDPNEKGSANSSLDKMESLLVEEDDDDGLGTESLRISGSEDENEENISPVRSKKRPTQKIIESDDENTEDKLDKDEAPNDNKSEEVKEPSEEKEETDVVVKKTNKFSTLIDSDSEPEEIPEEIPEKVDKKPKSKVNKQKVQKTTKKKKTKRSISPLLKSDSDNEEEHKVSKKKKPKSVDSESSNSDNEEQSKNSKENKKASGNSNLIDSDSESSNGNSDNQEDDQQSDTPAPKKTKKPQRASAKKAMTEMQALQSETQRLYRETQVSIPYHKPKRHTLKEFLNRNTIIKPSLNLSGPGKSLKMSPEELEEYAKQLDERAKEATEFFKSESEDELKDVEEKDKTIDKQPDDTPMETSATEERDPETQPDAEKPLNTEEIDKILQEHEFMPQPSTQELLDIGISTQSQPESNSNQTPSTSTSNEVPNEEEPKPSSSTKPSALAELKRRLLAEKNIPLIPKLKGDSNMIIDFETGDMFARKPTGVENLFERFMKSNKNNKRKPEETTPSQELQTTLKVAVIQEANKEKEPKPGAAYIKLKENLRTLISRKRKEDFQKKIKETKEEQDEYNKCCGLDEDEDEDEIEDDEEEKAREERKLERKNKKMQHEIVIDEEENEIDPEEYEDEDENEPDKDRNEDDEENEEEAEADGEQMDEDIKENKNQEDDSQESEGSSSSSSEEEEEETADQSTRKHRVIKAFEDSDEETENPDLNATSTGVLFAEEEQKNPEEIEDELLDLCSGQFAETQRAPVISQIPITQTPGNVTETELEDLCSGVFNAEPTQSADSQIAKTQLEPTQKTVLRIVSSDEEKEPEEGEEEDDYSNEAKKRKVKKLTKRKKKHVKLGFSDDEDEDEEQNSAEEIEDEQEDEEEIPQTFIDYDSEENEIEVQMSKKDCVKQATNFLEKEAELSESEWGSADEDEQNLDRYDKELGDEDEFDQQKLHTELEQIHMRKVLDDDIREVKKIQEMLFEDEEQDGVGRQRKFRWKNIESGFSLDDPAGGDAENDDQVDSADDEEEIKWRKMRFEREQLLMQKSKEEILAEVSATELGKKLLNTMEFNSKTNYVIEKEVLVAKDYKPPSFLIKQNDLSNLRNSFLNHDKEVLAKIAESIEKSGDYQRSDNEQVHKKASKHGNFVFVPLSEEENELRKRKAEELKEGGNVAKKMKTLSKKPLLLDRLL